MSECEDANESGYYEGYDAGRDGGREDERAKIVVWLRSSARMEMQRLADAIENGDHDK